MEKMENPYAMPATPIDEASARKENSAEIFMLNGRIGRMRFLAYGGLLSFCLVFIIAVPSLLLDGVIENHTTMRVFNVSFHLIALAPIPLMARRRLHDMSHSGWWALSLFVPGVNLLTMLYLVLGPGMSGETSYGKPPPKNPTWVYPTSFLMVVTLRGLFGFQ